MKNLLKFLNQDTYAAWQWCGTWLRRFWNWLYPSLRVLDYSRASLFVVAAGAAGLVATGQGRDMAVAVEEAGWREIAGFLLAMSLWGFSSWYWARLILDLKFNQPGTEEDRTAFQNWLISNIPRGAGVASFGFAAIALYQAAAFSGKIAPFVWCVTLGIGFYVFLIFRSKLPFPAWLRHKPFTRLNPTWSRGSFIVIVGLFGWATASPLSMGDTLGAGVVSFLVLTSLLHFLGWTVFATHQEGAPILKILLAVAVVVSFFMDNHRIRPWTAPDTGEVQKVSSRPSPAEALKKWNERWDSSRKEGQQPLIVVATAGGGSRAAYWTATVLGAIADHAGTSFTDHLFAISGVSGGSVGATVFTTLLAVPETAQRCDKRVNHDDPYMAPLIARTPHRQITCYEVLGQQILSKDFLAPTMAAMGYPDLAQRFIPFSLFPDRATALETAWEKSWGNTFPGLKENLMEEGFLSLFSRTEGPAKDRLPALLLNGTNQSKGKRIVTSNLDLSTVRAGKADFSEALDFFQRFGCEIRVSTAALNSARFTFVTPPGTVKCLRGHGSYLVDGGYYENFGAVTARQLLDALFNGPPDEKANLRPIVIQISSDPALPRDFLRVDNPSKTPGGKSGINEVMGPLLSLFNTREAHGTQAAHDLRDWVRAYYKIPGGQPIRSYYHFRQYDRTSEDAPGLPLGWLLSKASQLEMRDQLTFGQNGCALKGLLGDLRNSGPTPAFLQHLACCPNCDADGGK